MKIVKKKAWYTLIACSAPVGQNRVTPQLVLDPSAPKAGRHTRFPYVSYAPIKVYTPSEVGRNFYCGRSPIIG